MHESPIAQQLVGAAVRKAGDARVTRMAIRLGPEGGYVPDSLQMHIRAAATGTSAEGTEVEVSTVLEGGAELVSIEIEETA